MSTDFEWGVLTGFSIAILMWILDSFLYKRILTMIGDVGGREKIHGKWYKIEIEEEDS